MSDFCRYGFANPVTHNCINYCKTCFGYFLTQSLCDLPWLLLHIVRGIHLVEAIKQDSLNYNYPPMPIPYPCQWWHSVSAVQGKYERLRSFTNSYCDNEGTQKKRRRKLVLDASSPMWSHLWGSSLHIHQQLHRLQSQSKKMDILELLRQGR